ncbi:2356_t:CDS:1 [Ambispora gerdemannii]|uniref:2356_t:CDS:1 n=1 Tax=Ambispora gerdemannii TaxID=144530 RepID=A0A9N9F1W8_9GLOM|nr:2356_t:CDS:1 [Ambispora gerdemannii]
MVHVKEAHDKENSKPRSSTFGNFSSILIQNDIGKHAINNNTMIEEFESQSNFIIPEEKRKLVEIDQIQTNDHLSSVSLPTTPTTSESNSFTKSSSSFSSCDSRREFLAAPPKLYFTGTTTSTAITTPLSSTESLAISSLDRLAALKAIKPNHPYLNENTKSTISSPFSALIAERRMQPRPIHSNMIDSNIEIQGTEKCRTFPNAPFQHHQRIIVGKWLFFLGFLLFPFWWIGAFYLPFPRRRATPLDFIWRKRCEKIGIIFVGLVLLAALAFIILNPKIFD